MSTKNHATQEELLTLREVARVTNLSHRTVQEYVRNDIIRPIRRKFFGTTRVLVEKSEVDRFLKERRPPGNPNFRKTDGQAQ